MIVIIITIIISSLLLQGFIFTTTLLLSQWFDKNITVTGFPFIVAQKETHLRAVLMVSISWLVSSGLATGV
jgi:hypothetical protein